MTADGMNTAMGKLLENQVRHAITPDRTKSSRSTRWWQKSWVVKIYFLPPHQPWQRGANENTDGLLRKYCPNDEYIEKAV